MAGDYETDWTAASYNTLAFSFAAVRTLSRWQNKVRTVGSHCKLITGTAAAHYMRLPECTLTAIYAVCLSSVWRYQ